MLIHQIKLPSILDVSGKTGKQPIDTMDMWRFGDYKTTLRLTFSCSLRYGISKDDIDGSQVNEYYWQHMIWNALKFIAKKTLQHWLNYAALKGLPHQLEII